MVVSKQYFTKPSVMAVLSYDTSEAVNATLYIQIIGSLMYLTNTRLDICFVVNTLSQYMVNPKHIHIVEAKNVMMYLKGTLYYVSDMHQITRSDYMDLPIQIGQEVPKIERALQDVVLVWDQV